MAVFHGIQVYEILENGNLLNAIYTNTGLLDTVTGTYGVDIEIARKKHHDNHNKGVEGLYTCKFIEINKVICYDLEILKLNDVYEFIWSDQKKPIWKGLGLMAGTTHISVSYIGV